MSVNLEREPLQRSTEPKPTKCKPPTRDQMPSVIHEPDSVFPRMDRARKFTDDELAAELKKIRTELKAQGKPLIDKTWRAKTWSELCGGKGTRE